MNFYLTFIICCCFSPLVQAGYQATNSGTANSLTNQMLPSSPLTPINQTSVRNLTNTVATYPLLSTTSNNTLQQCIKSHAINAMTPAKTRPLLRNAALSILKTPPTAFKNYPTGSALFTGYPDIAAKFDTMIANFQTDPQFVTMFRKVHIGVLNELYDYLMGIFMNFNLQHVGITQTPNASGDVQISVPLFLQYEQTYAANTKTLIINKLMDVIESQFNSAIRSYTNNIPQTFATFTGKTAIQNDYSMDLTQLIVHQLEPDMVNFKKTYLTALGSYVSFFQLYTNYLNQPHPQKPESFTAFVDIGEQINQFLYHDAQNATDKTKVAFAKMNPPLFHFSYDDMCALELIPHLAKLIPTNVKTIEWPEHIVQAAQEGLVLNIPGQKPHPLAYFKATNGVVVRNLTGNTSSAKLFICLRLGDNLFEQELIAQPTWLNSWDGIVKILRACFGDFSALLGLNILDPVLEALIANVVLTQQGKDPNAADNISQACKQTLAKWNQAINGTNASQPKEQVPSLPSLGNIPNLPSFPALPNITTPPLLTQPGVQ